MENKKNENICKFCGQVMLDGRECNCPAAKEQREIKRRIINAKQAINDIFVNSQVESNVIPPSDEALELMKYCVELIAYDHIDKASIVLPGAVKANISKKGAVIKVERAETIKSSKETL